MKAPSSSILRMANSLFAQLMTVEHWFDYPVRVQAHHTDYAGVVWHGTYVAWMEEARVECLRSLGIEFADWVNLGFDLQVVDLSLRYRLPLRMGMKACVRTRLEKTSGIRLNWRYEIQVLESQDLCVTGQVTLVPVDSKKGKIMRRLTPDIQSVLNQLMEKFQVEV